jgi:type VI protein secretion system component Hcp
MGALLALDLTGPSGAIKGGSTDKQFAGKVELDAFSFSGPAYSGDKVRKPDPNALVTPTGAFNFVVRKKLDYSSPQLAQLCSMHQSGKPQPFPKAVLTLRPVFGYMMLVMTFSDLYLMTYKITGEFSDKAFPTEELTFSFRTFELQYQPLSPKTGNLMPPMTAGWTLKPMTKL